MIAMAPMTTVKPDISKWPAAPVYEGVTAVEGLVDG